jgi:hypothetical protein
MLIILCTGETEIGKITILDSPGGKVRETPSQLIIVGCNAMLCIGINRKMVTQAARPYLLKTIKAKRAGGMAQVVEPLPGKPKALSTNPNTERERENDL